ncbi:MAG: aminopeptidase N [Propionibacteriaceae bacterium]|jgi:aminopeptidase N|nr:aminopeptidase N [Propionibacteriaceae bacterium]
MPGKNLTRLEAEARSELLRVESYDVTLDLAATGPTFPSTTTVRFVCRRPGADSFIDLIAPRVLQISLNGRPLDPAAVFADCRIALPDLAADNELTVVAEAAWSHTGEGLHRFTDPVDGRTFTYTQFEVADARRVFACFEQPDLKASFTFHLQAPADWQVVSNQPTPAPSPLDSGLARWDFGATPVMSTYLTAVIAGPYRRWDSVHQSLDGRRLPLALFVRPSMAEHFDPEAIFDITKRGFDFYERAFGVLYPYDKYDQAFVPEYNAGAMENIGAVTLTEAYVFRSKPTQARIDRRAITILHEQAHMWFGDLVTMRWWNDLWLNESFAEFVSHLAAVSNTEWTDAWTTFQSSEKSWGYRQDQLPSTHPIVADIRDLADVEVNFDGITYAKGAAVLRQLVAWVGQDRFLAGVSAYLKRHAWGNATLADLLTELTAASGRDLTEWSRVWLEEPGVTCLRPRLELAGDTIESLTVLQEVPPVYADFADVNPVRPSLRPARLAIAGYDLGEGGLTRSWQIETDVAGPATAAPEATGRKRPDLLLLNDLDLAYAKLRLDPASLRTALVHLPELTDPLARALVWGSLWDATRDGELPGRRYIRAVLDAVSAETSSTTIQTLLSQLRTTVAFYVRPDRRDQVADQSAARLMALTLAAAPGSDAQLQFLKAVAGLARDQVALDFLTELYDGGRQLDGLTVDADLSWEILTALVAAGRKTEADIARRLTADPTTKGHESAAGARAALPDRAAKQAAWSTAVTDETITNATQRAIVAGFNQVLDRSALAEFSEPYFECLESVWAERSRQMATNVVEGLYPTLCLDQPGFDLVARTDRWLEGLQDRTPALRRLVSECRAGVVRARRAQAADSDESSIRP